MSHINSFLKENEEEWERQLEKLFGHPLSELRFEVLHFSTSEEMHQHTIEQEFERIESMAENFRPTFENLLPRVGLSEEMRKKLKELYPRYPWLLTFGLGRLSSILSEGNIIPICKRNVIKIFVRPRVVNLISDLTFIVEKDQLHVVDYSWEGFENARKSMSNFYAHCIEINSEMVYLNVEGIVLFNQIHFDYFVELISSKIPNFSSDLLREYVQNGWKNN